jgi:hypothetical protein
MRWTVLVALVALLLLGGCSHHPLKAVYLVGPECHASAKLYGCTDEDPPICKKIVLKYDKHCERLELKP